MKSLGSMRFGRYDYSIFLTFIAYAAGSVVVPVALVTLARDLNFRLDTGGMSAGGALHLGRTMAMVVTMLLCGAIAGRWGKRRTLGVAVLIMGFSMALCAIAPVYALLLAALLLAGLGEGLIEGMVTPFVQDLHADEPGRYINFSHGFWCIGVVITVLVSGALLAAGVPWRLVIGLVALTSLAPAWLLLSRPRDGQYYPEHPTIINPKQIWQQARAIIRTRRFWVFYAAMFVAGGGEFCLTYWCASYIQLNFKATTWMGGLGTAVFSGGMFIGRTGFGVLIRQRHLRPLIISSAVAGTIITLFLPMQTHLLPFMLLLFIAGVATAPYWPSVQSLSVDVLPDLDTTMLYILLACAGIPGCGTVTWLMGWLGNRNGGLNRAFYLVPCCFITLAFLVAAERLFYRSPRND